MLKKAMYILLFLLSFCMFSLKVEAKVYPEGECVYTISAQNGDGVKETLNVKIVQDSSGVPVYYYNFSDLNSTWFNAKDSKNMVQIEKADKNAWFMDSDLNYYTSCPQYIGARNGSGLWENSLNYHLKFFETRPDNSRWPYITTVDLDHSKTLTKKKKEDYEGESCPNTTDWLVQPNTSSSDDIYCLYMGYSKETGGGLGYIKTREGCLILQLHYKKSTKKITVDDANFFNWNYSPYNLKSVYIDSALLEPFEKGNCPVAVGIGASHKTEKREKGDTYVSGEDLMGVFKQKSDELQITYNGSALTFYIHPAVRVKRYPESNDPIIPPDPTHYDSCDDIMTDDMAKLLNNLVTILRIMIPIILNVFGVIDFGRAIFAGEEDQMKKAQSRFIKRLIIGICIYLIPTVLTLVLRVANKIWPVIDPTVCHILD